MPATYKELSLAQLRGFCETVRLGSLSAAAVSLGLAQPTVWKLVHSLEKRLGQTLFITDRRGCRPTNAARALYALASACLTNVESLPARLGELLAPSEVKIEVAGTPRLLAEDLVPCMAEFVKRHPQVRFVLQEMDTNEVADFVDSGPAQIGFTPTVSRRSEYPRLTCTRWYELDVLLVMRADHPLAAKKKVRMKDLSGQPMLFPSANLNDFPNAGALASERFDEAHPQWVTARQASVLRQCVAHGLGSAILLGRAGENHDPRLATRDLSAELGRAPVFLLRRSGIEQHPLIAEFANSVKEMLAEDRRKA